MFWRRSKKPTRPQFKVFYASDVHGSEKLFRKFITAGKFYSVDALIMGGDLTGKRIIPLVRQHNGTYQAKFMGRVETVRTDEERTNLEELVRLNGYYPYICEPEEEEVLRAGGSHLEEVFDRLMVEAMERWVSLADERLAENPVLCFVMPGNDDTEAIDEAIAASRHIVNHDGKIVEMGPYQLMGLSMSNPTPWDTPRELSEEALLAHLNELAQNLEPDRPWILNTHVPPYGSGLDEAPELTEDLRIVTIGGQANMVPVGSKAIDTFIKERQPLLSLHGHIHESRGTVRLGNTLAVNAGSEYNIGVLRGALITLQGEEVKYAQLISG